MTILMFPNREMQDIIRTVELRGEPICLMKGISQTIKNDKKENYVVRYNSYKFIW